jgi:integrase
MLISLESLSVTRDRWKQARQAANTCLAYGAGWRLFSAWCGQVGCRPLDASAEVIELFVVWCLQERCLRLSTVTVYLAALRDRFRLAGGAERVDGGCEVLRCARRQITEVRRMRKALLVEQLRDMSEHLETRRTIDVRNRALLVVGFAAGWRSSELEALEMSHVEIEDDELILWQPRSKTDQEGRGREVRIPAGIYLPTCPVRVLRDWLAVRGSQPGPVFVRVYRGGKIGAAGIRGSRINVIVQRTLREIGQDANGFGSHSLRAGMVTTAVEHGASELAIMQRTGHRNLQTVLDYVRPRQAARLDPLRGVL